MIIPDIMSWPHFVQLYGIQRLPIEEQVKRYNYYLMEQQALQIALINQQAVGSGGTPAIPEVDPSNCIQFTVDTTRGGTGLFLNLTTTAETTVTITWGDDTSEELALTTGLNELEHTFPAADTEYNVSMCFADPSVVTEFSPYF